MLNENDVAPFPWMKPIIIRVAKLVQPANARRYWRVKLKEWKAARDMDDRRGLPSAVPARATELYEKYTLLAALHDRWGEDIEEINPWGYNRPAQGATDRVKFQRLKESITFAVFVRNKLSGITDDDRAIVESDLADVEADLRKWLGGREDSSISPVEGGRESIAGMVLDGGSTAIAPASGMLPLTGTDYPHRTVSANDGPTLRNDLAEIAANVESMKELLATQVKSGSKDGEDQYLFLRNGDGWEVRFGQSEIKHFGNYKGFAIIARLLINPNPQKSTPAIELINGTSEHRADAQTFQPRLDTEAEDKYRERLNEIRAEIDEANEREDVSAVERLEEERDQITACLRESRGLDGRGRPLGPAPATEKARKAIVNNLTRVYTRLEKAGCESLAAHLRQAIDSSGAEFAYRPAQEIPWVLR